MTDKSDWVSPPHWDPAIKLRNKSFLLFQQPSFLPDASYMMDGSCCYLFSLPSFTSFVRGDVHFPPLSFPCLHIFLDLPTHLHDTLFSQNWISEGTDKLTIPIGFPLSGVLRIVSERMSIICMYVCISR